MSSQPSRIDSHGHLVNATGGQPQSHTPHQIYAEGPAPGPAGHNPQQSKTQEVTVAAFQSMLDERLEWTEKKIEGTLTHGLDKVEKSVKSALKVQNDQIQRLLASRPGNAVFGPPGNAAADAHVNSIVEANKRLTAENASLQQKLRAQRMPPTGQVVPGGTATWPDRPHVATQPTRPQPAFVPPAQGYNNVGQNPVTTIVGTSQNPAAPMQSQAPAAPQPQYTPLSEARLQQERAAINLNHQRMAEQGRAQAVAVLEYHQRLGITPMTAEHEAAELIVRRWNAVSCLQTPMERLVDAAEFERNKRNGTLALDAMFNAAAAQPTAQPGATPAEERSSSRPQLPTSQPAVPNSQVTSRNMASPATPSTAAQPADSSPLQTMLPPGQPASGTKQASGGRAPGRPLVARPAGSSSSQPTSSTTQPEVIETQLQSSNIVASGTPSTQPYAVRLRPVSPRSKAVLPTRSRNGPEIGSASGTINNTSTEEIKAKLRHQLAADLAISTTDGEDDPRLQRHLTKIRESNERGLVTIDDVFSIIWFYRPATKTYHSLKILPEEAWKALHPHLMQFTENGCFNRLKRRPSMEGPMCIRRPPIGAPKVVHKKFESCSYCQDLERMCIVARDVGAVLLPTPPSMRQGLGEGDLGYWLPKATVAEQLEEGLVDAAGGTEASSKPPVPAKKRGRPPKAKAAVKPAAPASEAEADGSRADVTGALLAAMGGSAAKPIDVDEEPES